MYTEHFADDGKHIRRTLDIFWRWSRIGFIGGQQKEKFGSICWYAVLSPIKDLHDIFKPGHVAYRWSPIDHPLLDFLNNLSKYFFKLKPILKFTFYYQVVVYNIAYYHALIASPGYEKEILNSCDHDGWIFGYKILKAKYGDGWSEMEE